MSVCMSGARRRGALDGAMSNPFVDDMAEEDMDSERETTPDDDEDSTEAQLRRMDERDFLLPRIIDEFNANLARPVSPSTSPRRLAPELYSRRTSPVDEEMPGPPTPRAGTPLFLPYSDDEGDTVVPSRATSVASTAQTSSAEGPTTRPRTPLFLPFSDDERDSVLSRATSVASTARTMPLNLPHSHDEAQSVFPSRATSVASTPARRPSDSPPPRKRQRLNKAEMSEDIRRQVSLFVDLEAEESGVEDQAEDDDADEEFADFIDDEPMHDDPLQFAQLAPPAWPTPAQTAAANEGEAERLEAAAERYRAMARQGPATSVAADDLSYADDKMWREPTERDTSMFRVSVHAGREYQLLEFLCKKENAPAVVSITVRALGSGHVYVECEAVELQQALRKYNGYSSVPISVPVSDRISVFATGRVESKKTNHHWGRITHGPYRQLYKNDLVIVDSRSRVIYAVPRIRFPEDPKDVRPPPRLFHAHQVNAMYPKKVKKRNQVYNFKSELYHDGLLEGEYEEQDISVVDVNPTEAEISLFAQSEASDVEGGLLESALYSGPSCALQEGDRVVVVAGSHQGFVGHIIAVTNEKHRRADRIQTTRVAAVRRGYHGVGELSRATLAQWIDDGSCVTVPIQNIRLHFLSLPRVLAIDDRVVVVGGVGERRASGRVIEITQEYDVRVEMQVEEEETTPNSPSNRVIQQFPMRHLQRYFRMGDVVKIIRGPHTGSVGFVVAVINAGYISFYPIRVSSRDIEFVPIDGEGFQLAFTGDWEAKSSMQDWEDKRRLIDRLHRVWERECMRTGRGYLGHRVKIVGSGHSYKGRVGSVKGWRFVKKVEKVEDPAKRAKLEKVETARRKRLPPSLRETRPDIILTVQLEASLQQIDVSIDHALDEYSDLPLPQAVLFKHLAPVQSAAPDDLPEDAPDPDTAEPAWVPTFSDLSDCIYGPVPNIGDDNGNWLLEPKLATRRIDIKVDGVRACLAKYVDKISSKTLSFEGRVGFVAPFNKPFTTRDLEKRLVEVRLEPMNHKALIPAPAIKPCRRTEQDNHGLDQCISAAVGRVVVIGPDVQGSDVRVGQYAETIPKSTSYGSGIVDVKFARGPQDTENPTGRYHLRCLCRSLNKPMPDWGIPATEF
ncbi:hypothetical protein B0H11DRAFT_1920254 [Mycena galericulata]|nr:hypothetical protein B0H11DRAFT_1920254 [Mycena galericulata]